MARYNRVQMSCQVEAEVAAPPEAVWRVVADVTRTGEWSNECRRVEWLDGASAATPGARFRGSNKSLWWRWSRTSVVTAVQPGHRLAWRTVPTWRYVDSTEWQIILEPRPAGTLIRQTYRIVRCPRWWEWVVAHANPPHRDRTTALVGDLRRLGDVAAAED